MPTSRERRAEPTSAGVEAGDAIVRARAAAQEQYVGAIIKEAIKPEGGFTSTLKRLKRGKLPQTTMSTVTGVVVEVSPSGRVEAALETDGGRMLIQDGQRTDRESTDPQLVSSNKTPSPDTTADSAPVTPALLLSQLAHAGANAPSSLVYEVELARFDAAQRQVLLPLLWQYIVDHRNSNDRDELVAVGAAIRKYIAIMPMNEMGKLAALLESGHRSPLPIELEIEVGKMVYRNFEVHPPVDPDPHPELAQRLWELVQAYINPRILLRSKHSVAACLAIEAIVAMRSKLAQLAWQAAIACPYRWFAELVSDDLDGLRERWRGKSPEAAAWLAALQKNVAVQV